MAIDPKDINIVQIAYAIGLVVGSKHGNEVEVRCPFCNDKAYHMSLNTSKNTYRCPRCGESGGVLHLYAKLNNCDTKTAYREIINRNFPEYIYKKEKPAKDSNAIKGLDERNAVYTELLSYLVLADTHKMDLLRRGLRADIIAKYQYKSVPQLVNIRTEICRRLRKDYDLSGIPGFFQNFEGEWDFYSSPGYMIPMRNKDGKIQGFQVRKDNVQEGEKRFKSFSSRGLKNGTKSEGYVHVVGHNYKNVYITEGPLKGDITNFISILKDGIDRTVVCIPGVNSVKYLAPTLNELGTENVCLAMDMDKLNNPYVLKAIIKIQDIIKNETNVKKIMEFSWEKEYKKDKNIKGIDDYMYLKIAR